MNINLIHIWIPYYGMLKVVFGTAVRMVLLLIREKSKCNELGTLKEKIIKYLNRVIKYFFDKIRVINDLWFLL